MTEFEKPPEGRRHELVERVINAAKHVLDADDVGYTGKRPVKRLRIAVEKLEEHDRQWRLWFYHTHGRPDMLDEHGDFHK